MFPPNLPKNYPPAGTAQRTPKNTTSITAATNGTPKSTAATTINGARSGTATSQPIHCVNTAKQLDLSLQRRKSTTFCHSSTAAAMKRATCKPCASRAIHGRPHVTATAGTKPASTPTNLSQQAALCGDVTPSVLRWAKLPACSCYRFAAQHIPLGAVKSLRSMWSRAGLGLRAQQSQIKRPIDPSRPDSGKASIELEVKLWLKMAQIAAAGASKQAENQMLCTRNLQTADQPQGSPHQSRKISTFTISLALILATA